jgi:hypothetical protein
MSKAPANGGYGIQMFGYFPIAAASIITASAFPLTTSGLPGLPHALHQMGAVPLNAVIEWISWVTSIMVVRSTCFLTRDQTQKARHAVSGGADRAGAGQVAIEREIGESLRQQFHQTGFPAALRRHTAKAHNRSTW